jgi:hypothetical protein
VAGVVLEEPSVAGLCGCLDEQDEGQGVVIGERAVGVAGVVKDVQDVPFHRLFHAQHVCAVQSGEQGQQPGVAVQGADEGGVPRDAVAAQGGHVAGVVGHALHVEVAPGRRCLQSAGLLTQLRESLAGQQAGERQISRLGEAGTERDVV